MVSGWEGFENAGPSHHGINAMAFIQGQKREARNGLEMAEGSGRGCWGGVRVQTAWTGTWENSQICNLFVGISCQWTDCRERGKRVNQSRSPGSLARPALTVMGKTVKQDERGWDLGVGFCLVSCLSCHLSICLRLREIRYYSGPRGEIGL